MKKFLLGSFGLGLLGAWACEPTVRWGDRSPSENEIKACHGADGSWVCSGPEVGLSKIPRKFTAGFGPNTPTSLPNWSVPLWVVDKHNRSGCAKDTNTCTSTTCGGGPVGPCATKAQITSRWGCPNWLNECVRITTAVVVDLMSEDTDGTDPWGFRGTVETALGGSLNIKAESPAPSASGSTTSCLQQSVTGTTPEQLTSAAFASAAAGNLITVTTTGPQTTRQWVMFHSVNTVFTTTAQVPVVLPLLSFTPTIGTCATGGGDTVAVTSPYAENIVDLHPRVPDYVFEGGIIPQQAVTLTNMTVFSPGGIGSSGNIKIGAGVSAAEVAFQRTVEFDENNGDSVPAGFVNVLFEGGIVGGRLSSGNPLLLSGGGAMPNAGAIYNVTGQGMVLDGFFWAAANMSFPQGVQITSMMAASPNFLSGVTLRLGPTSTFATNPAGYGTLEVWGLTTSVLNFVKGSSAFDPASGGFGAGWGGINGGATVASRLSVNLDGLSTGCVFVPGSVGIDGAQYCGISFTNTTIDSSAGTTAFGQHALSAAAGAGARFDGNL